MRRILLLVAATLFLAPAANAGDGVLEINQACAENTGCFSGDDPGWPVEIEAPGSYLLTGNLVLPNSSTTGIEVDAPNVSIDLNDFGIVTQACLNATSDCTPESGSGKGVRGGGEGDTYGVSVKNGNITGMGSDGILLTGGNQTEVTNVRVRWNRGDGIRTTSMATISGNTAQGNFIGIFAGPGSIVSGNIAMGNLAGIYAINGSTISGNTASYNDIGILAGEGVTVSGNTASENGQQATDPADGHGITAFDGSRVSGNTASNNTGYGLYLIGYVQDGKVAYAGNVISDNTEGSVFGDGVEFGPNLCNGDTTCP